MGDSSVREEPFQHLAVERHLQAMLHLRRGRGLHVGDQHLERRDAAEALVAAARRHGADAADAVAEGAHALYALQDVEFDRQERLYSIPALIGEEPAMRVARLAGWASSSLPDMNSLISLEMRTEHQSCPHMAQKLVSTVRSSSWYARASSERAAARSRCCKWRWR